MGVEALMAVECEVCLIADRLREHNISSSMAVILSAKTKTAHVNMMTDTIVANLPADALRGVVRAILTVEPSSTNIFEEQTRLYLSKTADQRIDELFASTAERMAPTANFNLAQQRLRSAIGCGMVLESFPILEKIVDESVKLDTGNAVPRPVELDHRLAAIDGDIVQAIQKRLLSNSGSRSLSEEEKSVMTALFDSLLRCRQRWLASAHDFPFERGISVPAAIIGRGSDVETLVEENSAFCGDLAARNDPASLETFKIKDSDFPRLFAGLWQLSSPSWGVASQSQMFEQFSEYITRGFSAFDMADHYGDAEIIFG
jgi:hypothetical protein